MGRERMLWWRWSARQLQSAGFVQCGDDEPPGSCAGCEKRISGRRAWQPPDGGFELCRRCATSQSLALTPPPARQEVRLLRLAMIAALDDGWRSKRHVVERSTRMIRIRASAYSRREIEEAWASAQAEFARRSARRICRPYDGSSRFGWRPGS